MRVAGTTALLLVAAAVSAPAQSPAPAPAAPALPGVTGTVQRIVVASRHVAPRTVDVWLPPSYGASPERRYPVLYMHDGQNLFDPGSAYGGLDWGVDEAMTRMIGAGAVREAIVVGVWNTPARYSEYMPQKPVALPRAAEALRSSPPGMRAPQSDAYLRYLVEELKPHVDRAFRTRPGPADTVIMGSSMGGLVSLYALLEYPGTFGAAGCVSTHWVAGDGIVVDWAATALPGPGRHRLYFDHGTLNLDAGYEPHQQRMDAALRAAGWQFGRDYASYRFAGADHDERSWRQRLEVPLAFLLGR